MLRWGQYGSINWLIFHTYSICGTSLSLTSSRVDLDEPEWLTVCFAKGTRFWEKGVKKVKITNHWLKEDRKGDVFPKDY